MIEVARRLGAGQEVRLATTRLPRGEPRDAICRTFVGDLDYQLMLANGRLAADSVAFGHRYGVLIEDVNSVPAALVGVFDYHVSAVAELRRDIPHATLVYVDPRPMSVPVGLMNAPGGLRNRVSERLGDITSELATWEDPQSVAAWKQQIDHVVVNNYDRSSERRFINLISAIRESHAQ